MQRRSLGGWAGLFSALLAIGAYAAYDLPYLDDPSICSRPLRNTIVPLPLGTDAELLLCQDQPDSEALRQAIPQPSLHLVPVPAKGTLRTTPATFNAGPERIHVPTQARRAIASATNTSPTADPV